MTNKKFYITTAIAYPNHFPHCGHALEIIQADVLARFYRLLGKKVHFQTGTDEHGTKNWETAQKENKKIMDFLNNNVNIFKKLYKDLNISYDYFIRTSDKKIHYPSATELWKALVKSDDIYKKNYKGKYCAGCESFKTELELENGQCPNHPTRKIQMVEEENYFFRLSKYSDRIYKLIESNKYKVIPEVRKNEILAFLKIAKDISFSRPKNSLPWGIPVPGDDKQVMYVWCDALSNYITGIGYQLNNKQFHQHWPADIHVIGKDILKFHAAFWPAMLLSAKVELPKKLFVHGFVLTKGRKMSKSSGTVIEPFDQIKKYGVDQFRYYILESMPIDADGDYTEKLLVEKVNTELLGNLSNFCYRVLSFSNKFCDSKVIQTKDKEIIKKTNNITKEVKIAFEKFNFKKAIDLTFQISSLGNKYFQDNEPWKLNKTDKEKTNEILSNCINIVKNLSILIQPIMPSFSEEIQKQLNVKDLKWNDLDKELKDHRIKEAKIIIKKLEEIIIKEKVRNVQYNIDTKVTDLGVKVRLAQITNLSIKKKHEGIERLKKELRINIEKYEKEDIIKEYNNIDKKTGVNSKENPNSVINLFNLIKIKKQLPQINTVVDLYNLNSVKNSISMATHNIDELKGNIKVRLSQENEKFLSIENQQIKLKKGEIVYSDDKRIIGRLSKQCKQTITTNSTKNLILVAFGNKLISEDKMDESFNNTCELITKYNGGEYQIIEDSSKETLFPLDLKVAQITKVEDHPDADKLYVLQLDLGLEKRQIVGGIKANYTKDDLKNKKIVIVSNMKPAKIRGVKSQGMLLAAEDGELLGLLTVKNAPPGTPCNFGNLKNNPKQISFDEFMKNTMAVFEGKATLKNIPLKANKEEIIVEKVSSGAKIR